jgi:hypothetical protein
LAYLFSLVVGFIRRRSSDCYLDFWTDSLGWFLLTVNCDGCVRTNECTINAACAVILNQDGEAIAFQIDSLRQRETILRTRRNAQLTAFADLFGNKHFTPDHGGLPLSVLNWGDLSRMTVRPQTFVVT